MGKQTIEVVIEKLVAGGDGLARHEGRVVFVPFSIPGERVRVIIEQEKRGFARGRIEEILEPSPARVHPPCPVFGVCGGCTLQHLRYEEQLSWKARLAEEALARTGGLRGLSLEIEPSPPYGYRSRVQLHRDERGRLGFMRRGSNTVLPVDSCPICVPPIQALLADPPGGRIRRLDVLASDGAAHIAGEPAAVRTRILDREIWLRPEAFFQSNRILLPALLERVLAFLSPAQGPALDLYCGVGLFAAFLAETSPRVTAVDANPLSMALARRNVPGRGHRLRTAAVEDWLREPEATEPASAVVVDPPRAGLSPETTAWLTRLRPDRLAYVSCDPVTLARDLGRLIAGGLRLETVKLFDFYPQTAHLEAVACLSG